MSRADMWKPRVGEQVVHNDYGMGTVAHVNPHSEEALVQYKDGLEGWSLYQDLRSDEMRRTVVDVEGYKQAATSGLTREQLDSIRASLTSAKAYLFVGGDFYQASKKAATLNLALREWDFIFDRTYIIGAGQYKEVSVYRLDIETPTE